MTRRVIESVVLVALLGLLVLLAAGSSSAPPSITSSYDTGRNGYRALYDVLQREGIPVTRLEVPLGLRSPLVRVLAVTAANYDRADVQRLANFLRNGGTVIAFVHVPGLTHSPRLLRFNVADYTNLALSKQPQR